MIAIAHINTAPITLGWRASVLAVELAHQAATLAHRAMLDAAPGRLLDHVSAWRDAEARLERALLRERTERFRARGENHLKEAGR